VFEREKWFQHWSYVFDGFQAWAHKSKEHNR
jgi:hypothetical protein